MAESNNIALVGSETLLGREDARMGLVQRVEKQMVLGREQVVADVVDGVAPDRLAHRVELAVELVVVDPLAPRRLMQPRQRAREIGDPGEGKLIEGDGGHLVLAKSDRR